MPYSYNLTIRSDGTPRRCFRRSFGTFTDRTFGMSGSGFVAVHKQAPAVLTADGPATKAALNWPFFAQSQTSRRRTPGYRPVQLLRGASVQARLPTIPFPHTSQPAFPTDRARLIHSYTP